MMLNNPILLRDAIMTISALIIICVCFLMINIRKKDNNGGEHSVSFEDELLSIDEATTVGIINSVIEESLHTIEVG